MSRNAFDINEKMPLVAPELASKYARYPLEGNEWIAPSAMITIDTPAVDTNNSSDDNFENNDGPEQIPAFIAKPKDPNFPNTAMKLDYVWGPGPRGYGYYHLLTKASYTILNNRLRLSQKATVDCCCFGGGGNSASNVTKPIFDDDVMAVIYERSLSTKANDLVAERDVIENAKGVASAYYHTSQNIQMVF
jgi:hypothetical protein